MLLRMLDGGEGIGLRCWGGGPISSGWVMASPLRRGSGRVSGRGIGIAIVVALAPVQGMACVMVQAGEPTGDVAGDAPEFPAWRRHQLEGSLAGRAWATMLGAPSVRLNNRQNTQARDAGRKRRCHLPQTAGPWQGLMRSRR